VGYFPEGPINVPAKVACLYYAADRKYNIDKINSLLDKGINVILDRYVQSNMGHQGGKAKTKKERKEIIDFIETLEYKLLELPKPDLIIFLHMPTKVSEVLKINRTEKLDKAESDKNHLNNAEKTYLYMAKRFKYKVVKCNKGPEPRQVEEISKDVLSIVKKFLKLN
jgi:dTMP kinase